MTLRELRERKFITVEELATKLGVSRQTVYYWETGKAKPTLANRKELYQIFGEEVLDCFK